MTGIADRVYQGERDMAADNKKLGEFHLENIPPAPAGVPKIQVEFNINADGIVDVKAKDLGTGKEKTVRIEANGGLSEAEIEKMVKDAEANAEEDKKRREAVEVTNTAEALMAQTKDALANYGDQIPAELKQVLEEGLKEVQTAIDKGDTEELKDLCDALGQANMDIGQAIYGQKAADAEESAPEADAEAPEAEKDEAPKAKTTKPQGPKGPGPN